MEISEREIQKAILDLLAWKKIRAWRTNSGLQFSSHIKKDGSVSRYATRLAPNGMPDIVGFLSTGKFLGIEVKKPGKEPTEVQQAFIDEINKAGGLAFCAHSLDEVQKKLSI